MQTDFHTRIPASLSRPSKVKAFEMRAKHWFPRLRSSLWFLRDRGMPNVHHTDEFITYLLDLEQYGTGFATLVGMMLVSGTKELDEVFEGLDVFMCLRDRLSSGRSDPLDPLSQHLLTGIFYRRFIYTGEHSTFRALKKLVKNFPTPLGQVGNCNIGAGLWGSLLLSFGNFAGEAHQLHDLHNMAFFPIESKGTYIFEILSGPKNKYRRQPFLPTPTTVLSNALGFVSAVGLSYANHTVLEKFRPGTQEIEYALALLQIIEAINPYHIPLYGLKKNIYQRQGMDDLAAEAGDRWQGLSDWSYKVSYPKT